MALYYFIINSWTGTSTNPYKKVNQNRNTHSKRRKVVTERYEKLEDLCKAFDALSPQEKTDRLFHFLYSFSHLDEYSISDCTDSDCTDSE